jgi:hypothetical protein
MSIDRSSLSLSLLHGNNFFSCNTQIDKILIFIQMVLANCDLFHQKRFPIKLLEARRSWIHHFILIQYDTYLNFPTFTLEMYCGLHFQFRRTHYRS